MDHRDGPPPAKKQKRDLCNNIVAAASSLSASKDESSDEDVALGAAPLSAASSASPAEASSIATPAKPPAAAALADVDATDDRWWCDDCVAPAKPSCSDVHPTALLRTAAARSTMLARLGPARKTAQAANKKLAVLQEALDTFEESLAGRGPRLMVSFDGCFDEWEFGIVDGHAPIALVVSEVMTSSAVKQVCIALTDVELTLDVEKEELSGSCRFPENVLEKCFPLRPVGQDLPSGAVLVDQERATVFLRRCSAKEGFGRRLLGYVEGPGLRALAVDKGACQGQCERPCLLCDGDIVVTFRHVYLDQKDARRKKERGARWLVVPDVRGDCTNPGSAP